MTAQDRDNERTYSVRVTRKEYDASLPWSEKALAIAAKKVRRFDHLGGFLYVFPDVVTAHAFIAEVGLPGFDCIAMGDRS